MKTRMNQAIILIVSLFVSHFSMSQSSEADYSVSNNLRQPATETSFQAHIVADKESSFRMMIQNPEKKKLQITISHPFSGILADTTIYEETYTCRYNFSSADDGKYTVMVRSGKEKFVKEIEINTVTTVNRNLLIR